MLIRIVAVGVVIFAVMVAVKDGRVLRTARLTGSCTATETLADGTQLQSCRAGKLEGRPNLSRNGCTAVGVAGPTELWRCPAVVAAGPHG